MIPGIAVFSSQAQQRGPPLKKKTDVGVGGDMEAMRRRNEELQRALSESREREEATRRELERTRGKLRLIEEAEERLCSQLGDLEAEASSQSRAYHLHIRALTDQLAQALHLRSSSSVRNGADCAGSVMVATIVGGQA